MDRKKSILFVFPIGSETLMTVTHPTANAMTDETLVMIYRNRACTTDGKIDAEAAVYVIGYCLNEVHEDAGEREMSGFGCDSQKTVARW